MWFIYALFWVYILGWFSRFICLNSSMRWLMIAILAIILNKCLPQIDLACLSGSLYWFGFFGLGVITRINLGIITERISKYGLCRYSGVIFIILSALYSALVVIAPIALVLTVIGLLAAISFVWFLQKLGIVFFPHLRKYTFTIYLLQWFAFVAIRNIFYYTLQWGEMTCYILMFISGILLPVAIGVVANKYIPRKGIGKYALFAIGQ